MFTYDYFWVAIEDGEGIWKTERGEKPYSKLFDSIQNSQGSN